MNAANMAMAKLFADQIKIKLLKELEALDIPTLPTAIGSWLVEKTRFTALSQLKTVSDNPFTKHHRALLQLCERAPAWDPTAPGLNDPRFNRITDLATKLQDRSSVESWVFGGWMDTPQAPDLFEVYSAVNRLKDIAKTLRGRRTQYLINARYAMPDNPAGLPLPEDLVRVFHTIQKTVLMEVLWPTESVITLVPVPVGVRATRNLDGDDIEGVICTFKLDIPVHGGSIAFYL